MLNCYVLELQRYDIVNGVVEVGEKDEAATDQKDGDAKEGTYFLYDSTLLFRYASHFLSAYKNQICYFQNIFQKRVCLIFG